MILTEIIIIIINSKIDGQVFHPHCENCGRGDGLKLKPTQDELFGDDDALKPRTIAKGALQILKIISSM